MTLATPHAASPGAPPAQSIDASEVERFARLAETWWDPAGPFRPLHKLNPLRLGYIRDRACAHFGRDPQSLTPFAGLRILDIGCGGGLLSEPMARLGARVVGADAAEKNIAIARHHAAESGLAIDYVHAAAEDLAAWGERFDLVLNMEVIEHVADTDSFLGACATLLNPGGAMVVATLNRSLRAYVMAIIGAEYVLGWLPRGTHDWNKFLRPSELSRGLRRQGFHVADLRGATYNPLDGSWRLSRDLAVNYLAFATR